MFLNRLPSLMVLLVALLVMSPLAVAGDGEWLTDYEKAVEQSKSTGKPILADFTGSDWCGWCIKLKGEVFSKAEFKTWAEKNVVLLELDFPKRVAQSAELQAQNNKLKAKYQIRGFPTILLLNADGEKMAQTGYVKGGPEVWIKDLEGKMELYKKSNSIQLDTLHSALKAAKVAKKPMLVIVSKDAAAAKKNKEALFTNKEFFQLVNSRTLAAHVDFSDEEDVKDQKSFQTLSKRLKIADDSQFVLIDIATSKLIGQAGEQKDASAAVAALNEILPKLVYNGEWLEDWGLAVALARQEKRPLFVNFTGSDWCGWCVKLDNEVFSKDEFKKYAKAKVILVKLDFPKGIEQSAALKAQNKGLATKYGIRGFPTLLVLDADGKKIGRMGYMKGGPEVFVKKLESIIRASWK